MSPEEMVSSDDGLKGLVETLLTKHPDRDSHSLSWSQPGSTAFSETGCLLPLCWPAFPSWTPHPVTPDEGGPQGTPG